MSQTIKTKKKTLSFPYALISDIGRRDYQEDAYQLKILSSQGLLAGIYDGHSGRAAVEITKKWLLKIICFNLKKNMRPESAFTQAYQAVADKLAGEYSGTTAITFYLKDNMLYHAHVGDSRLLIISSERVEQLTNDHRLTNETERQRILSSGGQIAGHYVKNIRGEYLMPTRVFGDADFKDVGVISVPETGSYQIKPSDKWLLAGTDGIFDVMSNRAVADLLSPYKKVSAAARALRQEVLDNRGGQDNLTFILVKLN